MTDGFVDLRSDTVTKPSAAMRSAMAEAEVGDDGYGEDPTVNRLEELFAARVGKDAAVLVPSGTMGNQLALRLLGRPGTLVVAGRRQHVVIYENGGAAVNGPVQFHPVDDDDGTLSTADVAWAIEAAAHHQPPVSAVCVEDTHMPAGGAPWPLDRLREIASLGVPVHLDGARLFNAEVATGIPAAERAACAATVMCCLSKGLGAPVGSMLAGDADAIEAVRGDRKRLGGSMRQAGVFAAAGVVALETMIERLADDHERARRVAGAVADRWPGSIDPERVPTNVVVWQHADPDAVLAHLRAEGVLGGTIAPRVLRLMTHVDVDDDGVERACKALATAP